MNNFISQRLPQDPKGGSKVTPSLAPTFLEKLLKLDIHQVGTNGLNGITLCFSVPHVPVLSSVRNRSAHAPLLDTVVSCRIIIGCLAQILCQYRIWSNLCVEAFFGWSLVVSSPCFQSNAWRILQIIHIIVENWLYVPWVCTVHKNKIHRLILSH